jgi:hypothetical protein
MTEKENRISRKRSDPYRIVKEKLAGADAHLTGFFFRRGGNVYVIGYHKEGTTRYTFIDSGDPRHRNQVLSILNENDINPENIERIIITHRHVDHTGLVDVLAGASKAKILAHQGFRSFVEGEMDSHERIWFGGFQADKLKKYNIDYLQPSDGAKSIDISGVAFPCLSEPIDIDGQGKLYILGCPECQPTHSPDQLIILYSARQEPFRDAYRNGLYPSDDIVFAGDLWLMQGPFHHLGFSDIPRLLRFAFRSRFMGGRRRNHREQDAAAKEALKRGFCLVRVKPGHGDEFIGSRIIPKGLLADRDIILELGYSPDTDRSILQGKENVVKVADIKEKAYANFITELRRWLEIGYTHEEVPGLLVRIYNEQSGGSKMVRNDRKQRKARLKDTLVRLSTDSERDSGLQQIARDTLLQLKK